MVYYPGLGTAFDVEEGLEYLDSLNPASKKFIDLNTTIYEKKNILDAIGMKKELNLNGYNEVQASFSDGDSGTYVDQYGKLKKFRLADVNRIDSFDQMRDVMNSRSKRARQPQQIAKLFGKPVEALTPEDYDQADRYHAFAINQMLNNERVQSFNPEVDYRRFRARPTNLAFRKVGTDDYGRDLVEAINPRTGTHASFEISNSPELNANFDFFKSLDTASNRKRLEQFNKNVDEYERMQEYRRQNRENRLGEDIDIIQSNAYRSFARLMDFLPEGMKDTLGIDKKKWERIAGPFGEQIADKWAGVDPTTREDYSKAMSDSVEKFKNAKGIGDYAESIAGIVGNLDRILADSAVQSSLAIGGAALGGVGAGLAGAGAIGTNAAKVLMSGILAGGDETLSALQDYKAEHGKDMPTDEAWKLFLGHIPIAAAEGILGLSGAKRLTEAVKKPVKDMSWKAFNKEGLKAFADSAIKEGIQEDVQQSWSELFGDPNSTIADLPGIMASPESIHAGITGSIMGGALSGANTTARAGLKAAGLGREGQDTKKTKEIQQTNQEQAVRTASGREASQDAEKLARDNIETTFTDLKQNPNLTFDDLAKSYKDMDELQYNPDVSQKMNRTAGYVRTQVLKKMSEGLTKEEFADRLKTFGLTPKETWEEVLQYNHPNTRAWQEENGGVATPEAKKEAIKQLSEFGRKLGLDDQTIQRNIATVANDVEAGPYGFKNYAKQMRRSLTALKKPDIDEDTKDKHTKRAQHYLDQMVYLAGSQLHKAQQFVDAIENIASRKTNQEHIVFRSKEGEHDMIGSKLKEYPYERAKYGSHGIFKDLMDKTQKMGTMLSKLVKEDTGKNLDFTSAFALGKQYNRAELEKAYRAAATSISTGTAFTPAPRSTTPPAAQSTPPTVKERMAPVKGVIGKMSRIPVESRNILATVVQQAGVLDQRKSFSYDSLKKTIGKLAANVKSPRERNLITAIADAFSRQQTTIRDIAGNLHAHYDNNKNVNRNHVVAALLADIYDRAMKNKMSSNEASSLVSSLKDDLDRKFYNSEKGSYQNSDVTPFLDEIFKRLTGEETANPQAPAQSTQPAQSQPSPPATTEQAQPPANTESQPPAETEASESQTEEEPPFDYDDYIPPDEDADDESSMIDKEKAAKLAAKLGAHNSGTSEEAPSGSEAAPAKSDELYNKVKDFASGAGHGISISKIQREFQLGYAKAEELFNRLVSDGIISEKGEPLSGKQPESSPSEPSPAEAPVEVNLGSGTETTTKEPPSGPTIEVSTGETSLVPAGSTTEVTPPPSDTSGKILLPGLGYVDISEIPSDLLEAMNAEIDLDVTEAYGGDEGSVDPSESNYDAPSDIGASERPVGKSAGRKMDKRQTLIASAKAGVDKAFIIAETARTERLKQELSRWLNDKIAFDNDTGEEKGLVKKQRGNGEVSAYDDLFAEGRHTADNDRMQKAFDKIMKEISKSIGVIARPTTLSKVAKGNLDDNGFTEKLINDFINNTLNGIKLDPNSVIKNWQNKPIRNFIAQFFNFGYNIDKKTNGWKSNPFYMLMYDFKHSGDKETVQFNKRSALAMRLATLSYLSSTSTRNLVSPASAKDMADMFGVNETEFNSNEAMQAGRWIVQNFGTPDSSASGLIGNTFMQIMGLGNTATKDKALNMFNRTKEGAGQFGIDVLVQEGKLIRDAIIPSKDENGNPIKGGLEERLAADQNLPDNVKAEIRRLFKNNVATIRPAVNEFGRFVDNSAEIERYLGNVNPETGEVSGGLANYYETTNYNARAGLIIHAGDKVDISVSRSARYTDGFAPLTQTQREAIDKMNHTEFMMNEDALDWLLQGENIPALLRELGFSIDIDHLSKNELDSQIGKNQEILRNLNDLRIHIDVMKNAGKDARALFKAFATRNGRINYEGYNPQMDKQLGRHLLPTAESQITMDVSNAEDYAKLRPLEAYAIAQAFDTITEDPNNDEILLSWLDSLSVKDIEKMRHEFLHNRKGFTDTYTKMLNDFVGKETDMKLGCENLGQCLAMFSHLIRKKKFNGKAFQTFVPVELDSTTSGYFLRILQMPHPGEAMKVLERLGVHDMNSQFANVSIDRMKKMTDDIYRFIARSTATEVDKMFSNLSVKNSKELAEAVSKQFASSSIDSEQLHSLFTKLHDYLPMPDKSGKIGKSFRDLIKIVAIPFGYNAGESSTKRALSKELVNDIINKYMEVWKYAVPGVDDTAEKVWKRFEANVSLKPDQKAKYKSAFETVQSLNTGKISNLRNQLLQKDMFRVVIPVKDKQGKKTKRSIDRVLGDVISCTYGQAAWTALDSIFADIRPYNAAINNAMQNISRVFRDRVTKRLKEKYNAEDPNDVSNHGITEEEYREIVKELKDFIPEIPSYFEGVISFIRTTKATGTSNFISLNEVKRITSKWQKVVNDGIEEWTKPNQIEHHSYAAQQVFDLVDQAAAVLGVHYTDGFAAQSLINNIPGLLLIHDAFCCSIRQMQEVSEAYNHNAYVISMNNDVMAKVAEKFAEVFKYLSPEEREMPLMDAKRNALEKRKKIVIRSADKAAFQAEYDELAKANKEKWNVSTILEREFVDLVRKYAAEPTERNTEEINVYYARTWEDYMAEVKSLAEENTINRNILAQQGKYVGNMPISNSYVSPDDIANNRLYHDKKVIEAHNSARGFTTAGQRFEVMASGLDNEQARVFAGEKVYGMAKDLGQIVEGEKHKEHLMQILRDFKTEGLGELELLYNTVGAENLGKFSLTDKNIQMSLYDNKAGKATAKMKASMPALTTYVHEVTHAATLAAILDPVTFKTGHLVQEALRLKRIWLENGGSWTDLMPSEYDPKLRSVHEQYAKDAFNYIANDNKGGLAEFISYALTYEPFINHLEELEIKSQQKPLPLGTRIYNLAKELWKLVTFNGSFRNVLNRLAEFKYGKSLAPQTRNMYQMVHEISLAINKANSKAMNRLSQHPLTVADHMLTTMKNAVSSGNKWLAKVFQGIFSSDKLAKYEWKVGINEGKISIISKLPRIALRAAFDKKARKAFGLWCQNVMNLSQTGAFLSLLRDVSPDDAGTQMLNQYATLSRTIDSQAKAYESTYANNIVQAFSNPPSDLERRVLTTGLIHTDAQSLLEAGYKHKDIRRMFKDREYLLTETDKARKLIEDNIKSEETRNYVLNQANALSLYMTERTANEALNTNAYMILDSIGIRNSEAERAVDTLATLYAIDMVPSDEKEVIANMETAGVDNFINIHKLNEDFNKKGGMLRDTILPEKHSTTVNPAAKYQYVKGFAKNVFDTSNDYKIGFTSDASQWAKDGYVLAGGSQFKRNGLPEVGVYVKSFANKRSRDGTAFMLRGQNMFTEAISSSGYRLAKGANPDVTSQDFIQNKNEYRGILDDNRKKFTAKMKSKVLTADELRQMNTGFIPVYSENWRGITRIVDYQISVPMEFRDKVVNDNMDGVEILSKTVASQFTNATADFQNERLLVFLIKYQNDNMLPDRTDRESGVKFIQFTDENLREILKDPDLKIPNRIMNLARDSGLYVREDWLMNLFGNKSITAADMPGIQKFMPNIVKTAIRFSEYVMKMTASLVKTNVLFKVPKVLIGNFISNIMYSVMTGSNPLKVMNLTMDNLIFTRDYMKDRKLLNELLMKQRLGTATRAELNSIETVQERLKFNPISELIEYGFLQSVIEDAGSSDMKNLKKVTKSIADSKVYSMTPELVKKGIRLLYVPEGTAYYDFMSNLTAISDFASRATEYQLRMEKAPAKFNEIKDSNGKMVKVNNPDYITYKENLINELWMAFVNYDTPQSSIAQYLNDTGLTMFTKYAFRIQKAIRSNLMTNPVGALTFLLTGAMFDTPENIMEQNVFQKHWSSLFHTPWGNFVDAIVPMPVQYATGMRKFDLI